MEKKLIYINNFWYGVNYGANLTAYALLKQISAFNEDTYLLDDMQFRNKILFKDYYVKDFAKKYLKTKRYAGERDAIVITGSDQVFNPNCASSDHSRNMLNFVNFYNKKIAYSASFGVDKATFLEQNSSELIANMKNSLKSFDIISVREKSGVEICKDIFDIDAECIIYPVFLMNKSEWEVLAKEGSLDTNGKIISYMIGTNSKYKKVYKYLSEKYKTNVIDLSTFKHSVESWLAAIRDCKFLITNSFHATCFAIIFNKPFICIAKDSVRYARFDSLFEMLGIKNQCVTVDNVYAQDCLFNVDYETVAKNVEKEKQKSIDFLKKAIYSEFPETEEKTNAKIQVMNNRIIELEKENKMFFQPSMRRSLKFMYNYYIPTSIRKILRFFANLIKSAILRRK